MAGEKRKRARRPRKADESEPEQADQIEGRLVAWRNVDRDNALRSADEPQKRQVVEKVLRAIVHFRCTILPGRNQRDGERPRAGAGSGWALSADQPKPKATGHPGASELTAWEIVLSAGGFTDGEIAEFTEPGAEDGAARVEQRRRRHRRRLEAESGDVS